jgi:hypothetical protein
VRQILGSFRKTQTRNGPLLRERPRKPFVPQNSPVAALLPLSTDFGFVSQKPIYR